MVSTNDCWLYAGVTNTNGYPQLRFRSRGKHYNLSVHRLMYEKYIGEIPEGLELDHLCMVRCCINPDHLEAVTHAENVKRTIAAGNNNNQKKTMCPQGHPYTPENTELRYGFRYCRACRRERGRHKLR